mgnify:CR=1 FL=1
MLAGIGSWLGAFQAGAAEAVAAPAPAILILGDSLSAEYGLKRGSGWVALLTQRLQRERIAARVRAHARIGLALQRLAGLCMIGFGLRLLRS